MNLEQIFDLIRESFTVGSSVQGGIIAFLAALMMPRYGRVLIYSLVALIFDQFLVPLALRLLDGKSLANVGSYAVDIFGDLDPRVVVLRFVSFFILISVLFALKSIIQRFGAKG